MSRAMIACWLALGWPAAAAVQPPAETSTETAGRCGPLLLSEVAAASGVEFTHRRGGGEGKHLPETMGAGLAWLDYDGDGWWDLYLVQSGEFPPDGGARARNRLFRNLGEGRFAEVTSSAGGDDRGYGQGVVAADLDGDGDTDLYVTNYGDDVLLDNAGDGNFEDVTVARGLGLDGWSSSAALADADRDGDLDLYVSRYVEYDAQHDLVCTDARDGSRRYCDPSLFLGAEDRFYRNLGDGRFADFTQQAGLAGARGRGLGVLFVDLDGDQWPEIYVANDLNLNLLFDNLGDGSFEDVSLFSGAAVNRDGKPEAGMGVAIGDVDGDLDPDIAVTNFDVETNGLYRNLGALLFEDVSASSGFGPPSFNLLAFGIVATDLDRDADLDFYIADGHIFERPGRDNVAFAQRDQILLGDGGGAFTELRCQFLDERPTVARGLAEADFDNDGDPDLAVQVNDGVAQLVRNDGPDALWLGLQLRGGAANRDAVGARVVLSTAAGRQVRWVLAGDSYQSSSARRPLFGLGQQRPRELEIRWPSGRVQRWLDPPMDRYLVIRERR